MCIFPALLLASVLIDRPLCGKTKVCYSYWVLSSMAILNKLTWIDAPSLTRFILSAQVRCGAFGRRAVHSGDFHRIRMAVV